MFNFMRLPPLRRLMLMKAITGGGSWETISGNPVSFTAKAAPLRKLEVAFSPVQDLHGYDSPWPAGGGKNKLNPVFMQGSAIDLDANLRIVAQNGIPVQAGKKYTFSADDYTNFKYVLNSSATDALPIAGDYSYCGTNTAWKTTDITFTATKDGFVFAVVSTPDNSIIYPADVANVKMQFEESASATSYAPYSNECPISGWDSLNVEQRGKNLCDGVAYFCEISYNIARVISTTPISSPFVTTSNYAGAGFIAPVKAGQAYAMSSDASGSNIFYWAIYASLDDITDRTKVLQSGSASVTFTANHDGYVVFMRENHPTGQTVTWTYAQIELGSTATEYAPYNPSSRSISISIGSTVYSGYVDVVTGVMTVTHKIVDLGSFTWTFSNTWGHGNTGDVFYSNLITDAVSTNADVTIMCSMYMHVTADWLYAHNTTDCIIALPATTRLYIRDFSTQDADVFKTKVTGQTVHYPLATPLTIQLTPQEVESLAGDNTMFSDSNGDLTVTYRSN